MTAINPQTESNVYGYFDSESAAETAVRELQRAGFARDQISLAARAESEGTNESTGALTTNREDITGIEGREHPVAYKEGHKAGENVRGFWDRIRSVFEGDAAEPYSDETSRGDLATHEVTGVYDYDPEDFHRTWGGTSGEGARYFTNRWQQTGRGVLVSVNAGDRRAEAESILERNGADLGRQAQASTDAYATAGSYNSANYSNQLDTGNPINQPGPAAGSGTSAYEDAEVAADQTSLGVGEPVGTNPTGYATAAEGESFAGTGRREVTDDVVARTAATDTGIAAANRGDDLSNRGRDFQTPQRIQLYGEVLRVHRDRIQRGEVRLRKEVVTEMQTIDVPVTREEIVVERMPVQGEQPARGARLGEDSEIRIPLSEDQVSVTREPVVREEVEIGKREVTNTESREEPVRREELKVDNQDPLRKAS